MPIEESRCVVDLKLLQALVSDYGRLKSVVARTIGDDGALAARPKVAGVPDSRVDLDEALATITSNETFCSDIETALSKDGYASGDGRAAIDTSDLQVTVRLGAFTSDDDRSKDKRLLELEFKLRPLENADYDTLEQKMTFGGRTSVGEVLTQMGVSSVDDLDDENFDQKYHGFLDDVAGHYLNSQATSTSMAPFLPDGYSQRIRNSWNYIGPFEYNRKSTVIDHELSDVVSWVYEQSGDGAWAGEYFVETARGSDQWFSEIDALGSDPHTDDDFVQAFWTSIDGGDFRGLDDREAANEILRPSLATALDLEVGVDPYELVDEGIGHDLTGIVLDADTYESLVPDRFLADSALALGEHDLARSDLIVHGLAEPGRETAALMFAQELDGDDYEKYLFDPRQTKRMVHFSGTLGEVLDSATNAELTGDPVGSADIGVTLIVESERHGDPSDAALEALDATFTHMPLLLTAGPDQDQVLARLGSADYLGPDAAEYSAEANQSKSVTAGLLAAQDGRLTDDMIDNAVLKVFEGDKGDRMLYLSDRIVPDAFDLVYALGLDPAELGEEGTLAYIGTIKGNIDQGMLQAEFDTAQARDRRNDQIATWGGLGTELVLGVYVGGPIGSKVASRVGSAVAGEVTGDALVDIGVGQTFDHFLPTDSAINFSVEQWNASDDRPWLETREIVRLIAEHEAIDPASLYAYHLEHNTDELEPLDLTPGERRELLELANAMQQLEPTSPGGVETLEQFGFEADQAEDAYLDARREFMASFESHIDLIDGVEGSTEGPTTVYVPPAPIRPSYGAFDPVYTPGYEAEVPSEEAHARQRLTSQFGPYFDDALALDIGGMTVLDPEGNPTSYKVVDYANAFDRATDAYSRVFESKLND